MLLSMQIRKLKQMLLEFLAMMKKKQSKHRESQREIDAKQNAKIERLAKEEIKDDKTIAKLAKEVAKLKHHEKEEHKKHRPVVIKFKFGKVKGQTMPATLNVGQSIPWTPTETDVNGANVPVVGANISASTDNPGAVSLSVDATTGVVTFTGVAAADSVNCTGNDTKFNLSFTDQLTVLAVEAVPTAISFSFGTPA